MKFKDAKKFPSSSSEDKDKYKPITSYRKFTEEEISKLEEPTPDNISSVFKVGDIIFDSIVKEGIGASQPKEILEASFYIFIKPEDYLKITPKAKKIETIKFLLPNLKKGYSIGIPRLRLHKSHLTAPYDILQIKQHEGRGRTRTFIEINGKDTYMPVLVTFPRGKEIVMANQLTEEILKNILTNTKWIPQKDEYNKNYDPTPISIDIQKIFWQGKEIQKH